MAGIVPQGGDLRVTGLPGASSMSVVCFVFLFFHAVREDRSPGVTIAITVAIARYPGSPFSSINSWRCSARCDSACSCARFGDPCGGSHRAVLSRRSHSAVLFHWCWVFFFSFFWRSFTVSAGGGGHARCWAQVFFLRASALPPASALSGVRGFAGVRPAAG